MASLVLDESENSPLSSLRTARKAQIVQIASLKRSIEAAKTAQNDATADLRNLEYVAELTRDEIASRYDGNVCLEKAYSGMDMNKEKNITNNVQRTEAKLLVAKSELSALRLSIDQLYAHEKRMKVPTARRVTSILGAERLIADVDVVVVANSVAAPGRVGVAPTGTLSLLGYHSADPVRKFDAQVFADDESCSLVELSQDDQDKLKSHMKAASSSITLAVDSEHLTKNSKVEKVKATIVGIEDALHATASMVNATQAATTVGEQPFSPMSPPRSSRRPLSY